jgi:CHAP domain
LQKHRWTFRTLAAAIAAALWLSSAPAQASPARPIAGIAAGFLDVSSGQAPSQPVSQSLIARTKAELRPQELAPAPMAFIEPPLPSLPTLTAAAPSIETPLRKLFCVEYARMRSGLAVFGDAKYWWERARNLYARASHPVEEAVMVFSGSPRLKRGHVAVVTQIVGPRQIIVDQANWQNQGEIDHATPVLDVSSANDWSKVRVWDIPSGGFGTHVYAISGFIAKERRTASRN